MIMCNIYHSIYTLRSEHHDSDLVAGSWSIWAQTGSCPKSVAYLTPRNNSVFVLSRQELLELFFPICGQ